ncbi:MULTISPECIES: DUF1573 domain-containing protein [unclassified Polaribacter]|uniref:DUF1573 domain-containing protein n=1 Tax=unclassified Polaribacter TaxID=196858 RepID=UPI0011BDACBC|nr:MULTISPECIES: DUF1573 domain-containing protein [unclassified Polaribacter]TXD50952.1 DUF1573 domain-containing protein [Polaribacter sp. IC063]TXD57769.1 DUF1573 domain-containing protein [Polaribacter sp. IC066]
MKTFATLLMILFISISTNAQEFKFEKETINYGTISKNANGEKVFVFTNIGNEPLINKNIQSTCGCTVPKKPEKPIMPGEKGEIKVSYDTKRVGGFSKSITIFSNAKNARKVIRIKGIVSEGVSLEKEKSMLSDS